MPDPLELPRVRCTVVPLVRGKGFAGFRRRIVNKLVTLALGHAFRGGGRLAGRRSGLVPCLATVIRALNDLSKPAARLRSVQPIRISGRSLEMIDFPARKVGTADVQPFALCVRCQDERALARPNQYSYSAHNLLLPAFQFLFNLSSLVAMLLHGQPHDLSHRPDLDRSNARSRNPSSNADRLIEILGMDQEVAGDLLARLHERTVGHETFAVADPNDRRRRRRLQRRSTQIFPVGVELVCQLDRFLKHLLSLGLAELAEGLLVVVNQQHVFHKAISPSTSDSRSRESTIDNGADFNNSAIARESAGPGSRLPAAPRRCLCAPWESVRQCRSPRRDCLPR